MKRRRIVALVLALTMVLGTAAMAAEYTVVKGDSLSKIAQKELGSASRWKEIWEANKDTVKNPNKISVGQKLTIPGKEEPAPAQPSQPAEPAPSAATSVTATAPGFEEGEVVTVTVTVDGGKIVDVVASSNHESEFGQRAIKLTPKAMVEQNTVNVDTCTGATTTSTAIINAARKAMAQLTEQNAAIDLDAWALANGYIKAEDYGIDTSLDAITGASEAIDASLQLTQKQIRALALDYLRGWPLKTDEDGNTVYSYREMYQIATSYNNVPGLSSVEFVLDPTTMKLYASSEKGTEKCEHIKKNPNVVMYWYHQIPEEEYIAYANDYFNSYGVQIKGTAKIMDPASDEAKHAADIYIETLYGAESWNARTPEQKATTIAMLLKVNDWIEIDPTEYIVNSLLWRYNKEGSARPEYFDPDSPYYGKSVRQVYYVTGETINDVYVPGTYTAEAKGFGGAVTATVTVDADSIVDVKLTGPDESEGYGAKALPTLEASAKAKGAKMDAVSGASTTSAAAKTAVTAALAQAAGRKTLVTMKDGTYTETAWGFGLGTPLSVDVEIKDNKLVSIVPNLAASGETAAIANTAVALMIPRIISEQSLDVDAISGATSTSNAIKQAVAAAIRESMSEGGMGEGAIEVAMLDWHKTPSYDKTGADPIEVKTQVLVVGGGGTGTVAAYQAQVTGADTLVIETSAKYGGTGALTTGPMTVNAPSQVKAFGNRDLVDSGALLTQWLDDAKKTEDSVSGAIIKQFMTMSGYDMDWMTNLGFSFGAAPSPFKFPAYQVWTMYNGWFMGLSHQFFNNIMAKYTALGGKTMFETTGETLLLDDSGKVIGVKAVGYDGQVYNIYADAVVLATGGYAGSTEYLKEFTKSDDRGVYQLYGVATNVGTAITMARQVDGKISDNVDIVMAHFSAPSQRIHAFTPADNQIPSALALNQNTLALNQEGVRFLSEMTVSDDAGDETARYYAIWGSDALDKIKAEGFVGSTGGMYMNPGSIRAGTPVENLYTVLDYCVDAGFVWKADTLEGLAAAISASTGASMASLPASVAHYNELCAAGEDTDFGKPAQYLTPVTGATYYAVEVSPIMYSTSSSVDVDTEMRLVTNDGKVVENLFIGGLDSIGMLLDEEYVDYGAVAQAWSFYSGRLGGMNAALYALGAKEVKTEQTGIAITDLGSFCYNVVGTAAYDPAAVLAAGYDVTKGQHVIALTLPSPDGKGKTAVVKSMTSIVVDGDPIELGQTLTAVDGAVTYPLQVTDTMLAGGGVVLQVEWDGVGMEYVIHTDFLMLSKETTSTDCTADVAAVLAADAKWKNVPSINIGTEVRTAGAADGVAVYELGGLVSKNTKVGEALKADAAEGEYFAAVVLAAPAGFESGSFTIDAATGVDGETMKVLQAKIDAVGGKALYFQQFLPAVYRGGSGESLVTPGTLSREGVVLEGTWKAGTKTAKMKYVILFNGLYVNFNAIDMTAELGDKATAGVAIQATDVTEYDVSKTGTVNVILAAPDPFFAYKSVTFNGETITEFPGNQIVVPVELKAGENKFTATWSGTDSTWGSGADYVVEYVFNCK